MHDILCHFVLLLIGSLDLLDEKVARSFKANRVAQISVVMQN